MSAFQELKIAVCNHTILEFNFCREKMQLFQIVIIQDFLLRWAGNKKYLKR